MSTYHESWDPIFNKYNFDLDKIYANNAEIYPKKENIYKIFEMNVKDIRVVLLGQDPYHGPGQAHGLSFSVPDGVKIPPSLKNIYKELLIEYPERKYDFKSGNLINWVNREKIFLLNSSLSVIRSKPGSMMKIWENFTNEVIKYISENNSKCVFLLLGNFAKKKEIFIKDKNRIVYGVHPSPMSAYNGFIDSGIFLEVEKKLNENIDWSI